MAYLTPAGWLPNTESQKNAVLQQLERLLGHAAFRQSKRNQALLRYIVEHQIQNPGSHLKERTIGIEVFGRDAGYDTNVDPVVRIVAGEIRRRIAQYYHEAGHAGEIRIELPTGTYAPEFHLPSTSASTRKDQAASPTGIHSTGAATGAAMPKLFVRKWLPYAVVALLIGVVGLSGMVGWHIAKQTAPANIPENRPSSPLHQFWDPIASSPNPVQLVLGTRSLEAGDLSQSGSPLLIRAQSLTNFPDVVGWRDLVAASRLIGLLQKDRKAFFVEDARTVTVNNLTRSPAILVGAFNNPWVMTLGNSLRLHFVRKGRAMWIADRDSKDTQYMLAPGAIPGSIRDFGIIARLTDKVTGQISIIVAGIGAPATLAASQFVTNAHDMESLIRQLPKAWESKNLEVLISVQAIDGEPGASHIVAVHLW